MSAAVNLGKQAAPGDDVFISYSRKDEEFVRRLDDELKRRGRQAWVDWEGIRPTEEFMEAIFGAIEGADTFVFVLSPDSVVSKICEREIAHAALHNKRIIPLVAREVDAALVPEAIAKLNWIFGRESDDFEQSVDTLVTALDTDLEWVHSHTRLLTRAVEWEAKGKNNSFVLRGDDLREAERWLTEAGADKERQPTALQTEYIIASRKAAARRQRSTLGAVSFGAVVAVVLAVIALFARQEAVKQRDIAKERQEEAERQSRIALSRQLAAQAQAMVSQQPKLMGRAGLLAIEAAQLYPSLDADQALRSVLAVLPQPHFSLPSKPAAQNADFSRDAVFSTDGDSLVIVDGDRMLRGWNLPKRRQEWEMPLGEKAEVAGVSPNLSQVALRREDSLVICRPEDGRETPLKLSNGSDAHGEVAFNRDGSSCIVRTSNGSHIFNLTTGKEVSEVNGWATFDPKGGVVKGQVARIENGQIPALIADFKNSYPDRAAAWAGEEGGQNETNTALSSNEQYLAVWHGQTVRAYEIATRRLLGAVTNDQDVIEAEVDDRGRFLVVLGERGVQTRIWKLSPVQEFARFTDSTVNRVRFSPDGSCFATIGSWVESVRLWLTLGGEEVTTIKTKVDLGTRSDVCALDSNGEYLLMPGSQNEAAVRAVKGGRKLVALPHRGVLGFAISHHDDRLVTLGGDDGIRIWQLQRTGGKITGASGPVALKESGEINGICLSEDGTRLFTAGEEIHLWNTASGELIARIPNQFGADTIACSADGTLVAVGNRTSQIRIISVQDKKLIRELDHPQHVSSLSLTADGRYLATSAWRDFGYQARVWDVATGQQVTAATHDREVSRVFFSPDGRSIVTTAVDNTSRLWSLDFSPDGKPVGTTEVARIQTSGATSMTDDGRYLATASDGAVRIWDLKQEDLIAQVQARSFRNLTRSEWKTYLGQMPYRKTCPELPEEPE
ncbi:MAG: toll/interleukin-1 receptor domain-containing protein [Chthoniobacterales bacterium]|nr:toll/interleukin-1 receptor domain-containing protein [Chthoniobacterales bacterium]